MTQPVRTTPERLIVFHDDDRDPSDAELAELRAAFRELLKNWSGTCPAPRLVVEEHAEDGVVATNIAVELRLEGAPEEAAAAARRVVDWAAAIATEHGAAYGCELDDHAVGWLKPGEPVPAEVLSALRAR